MDAFIFIASEVCIYMRYNFSDIGQRIRELRVKKKWSQETFIEKLNDKGLRISRNTISAVENGEGSKFSLDFLLACCKLFDCDISYLLCEYDECQTKDNQFIHEATGLSEYAINQLKQFHNDTLVHKPLQKPLIHHW